MLRTDLPHTRTLTLVLDEADWRSLRDVEPDAVAWLQQQVRARLLAAGEKPARPAVYAFHDDEY